MNIDKFKRDDGYYDEKDCFYENAESFLQGKVLKFCGCGSPDLSLKFIRKALRQVQNLKELVLEKKQTHEEWSAENKKIFGESEYFVWYFLDREGFTEHGGSIPGWLTKSGIELLEDLDALAPEWDKIDKEWLAERIQRFLNQYAGIKPDWDPKHDDEDDKFTSPDASQMKYCADMLSKGAKPLQCWSEWSGGGYKPYSSKEGRDEHDYLVKEIYKIING